MAGYKKSIMTYKPSCFLTFDGDSYFDGDGYLRYPYIHDESGNENHGYIITSNAPVRSYTLGSSSLVDRESGHDQYSIQFAPRSHDTNMPFPYDRSVVEIMHSETIKMRDEFTIMFLFKKSNNDSFFAGAKYDVAENKYISQYNPRDFKRTIFRKGVLVGLDWEYYWSSSIYNKLRFIFPDHNYEWILPSDFYGRTYHITMTRKKNKIGTSLYQTIDTVYIDGRIVYTKTGNITSETSTAFSTSSVFLGGNADGLNYNTLNDRQTSPLWIDQFTIFSEQCLTADQISNLYKKCFYYKTYIRRQAPSLYATFEDNEIAPSNTTHSGKLEMGSGTLQYFGTTSQLKTKVEGPIRLMGEPATEMKNGGMARIQNINTSNYLNPAINSSGDWSLEFFVRFNTSSRGVIFSAQTDYQPYKGLLIEANVKDDEEVVGAIQVKIEEGITISTTAIDSQGNLIRYNDDKFHFITVIRRGSQLEFWIDGVLVGSRYANNGNMINSFGTIYLFGMMPNKNFVNGAITHMAYYTYAMQEHMIRSKSFFYTRMKIKGNITLQGSPHNATLRVMNHSSGEVITEAESDLNTGNYEIDVYTDQFLDVLVFDKKDQNVRYRAFGPLLAGEYTDIDDNDV